MLDQKNAVWIWIAVDRYAKELVNFTIGNRSAKTGKELWKGIKNRAKRFIATDYWKPYESFVPKKKHIQSKVHTFTVEGIIVYSDTFLLDLEERVNVTVSKEKCWNIL